MEEVMDQLIEAIKKDPRYKAFKESEKNLVKEKDLLQEYRQCLDHYQEMKRFEKYVDISKTKEELKAIRKRMQDSLIISRYYQCYHQLNDWLDEISKIIYQDISDELLISQYDLG